MNDVKGYFNERKESINVSEIALSIIPNVRLRWMNDKNAIKHVKAKGLNSVLFLLSYSRLKVKTLGHNETETDFVPKSYIDKVT